MSKHGHYIERLKAALIGYLRKKLALAAVDSALTELLTHNPQKMPQARTLVKKAVDAGLSVSVANAPNTKISAREEAVNDVAFLETVVLRPSARAKAEVAAKVAENTAQPTGPAAVPDVTESPVVDTDTIVLKPPQRRVDAEELQHPCADTTDTTANPTSTPTEASRTQASPLSDDVNAVVIPAARAPAPQFQSANADPDATLLHVDDGDRTELRPPPEFAGAAGAQADDRTALGEFDVLSSDKTSVSTSAAAFSTTTEPSARPRGARLRKQQEERRLAKIKKLKASLLADAKADKPHEAAKKLDQLHTELPADDPLTSVEVPLEVALAYQRLALQQADGGHWENAAELARAAVGLSPDLEDLAGQLSSFETELSKMASILELKKRLASGASVDFAAVKTGLAKVQTQFPDQWRTLKTESHAIVVQRLKSIEKSDLEAAYTYRDRARVAFPSVADIDLSALPSKIATRGLAEVTNAELSAARASLAQTSAKDGENHADVVTLRAAITERVSKADAYYKQALKFIQKRQLRKAKQYLVDGAMKLWADNPDYEKLLADLSSTTGGTSSRKGECSTDKAGHGIQSRGTCYDQVAGSTKGPILVVVPAGDASKSFAIGQFEVSVAEYNGYCRASGKCSTVSTDSKLPITGVTVTQTQSYAAWLSAQSGATYRLPSENEWEYAATAGGKQPKKDFNCRVTLGNQVLKGHALVDAKSGQQNGWELANYIGNAPEWVRSVGAYKARGGADEVPLSKCDISVTRNHSGGADGLTGFRLLRELG